MGLQLGLVELLPAALLPQGHSLAAQVVELDQMTSLELEVAALLAQMALVRLEAMAAVPVTIRAALEVAGALAGEALPLEETRQTPHPLVRAEQLRTVQLEGLE